MTPGFERAERVSPALKRVNRDECLTRGLKAFAPPTKVGGFHRGVSACSEILERKLHLHIDSPTVSLRAEGPAAEAAALCAC